MWRVRGFPGLIVVLAITVAACGGREEVAETEPEEAEAQPCAAEAYAVDPALVSQGDRELNSGGLSEADLIARGGELWNDTGLSTNGSACATCHVDGYALMKETFADPYPHYVQMAEAQAGLDQVNAAEMVQLCMVIPMAADPLPWESVELAALSAYVEHIRPGFDPSTVAAGTNPCAANPCNPCAANPCNPCAANPCNPCAGQ